MFLVGFNLSCVKKGSNPSPFPGVRNALLRALRAQHSIHAFKSDQRFPSGATSALIIGGGATTRSAVYALGALGLNPIFLVNRDEKEVRTVVESFSDPSTSNGRLKLVHLRGIDVVDKYFGASMTDGGEERTPPLTIIVGAIPGTFLVSGSSLLLSDSPGQQLRPPFLLSALSTPSSCTSSHCRTPLQTHPHR